ncbi:Uncharacterised protein [Mycobacteroides abscessus subsp. abscessus]|nr:Uncharacterised protein [Mycobacteroides abscessus subsp. abscessus]
MRASDVTSAMIRLRPKLNIRKPDNTSNLRFWTTFTNTWIPETTVAAINA